MKLFKLVRMMTRNVKFICQKLTSCSTYLSQGTVCNLIIKGSLARLNYNLQGIDQKLFAVVLPSEKSLLENLISLEFSIATLPTNLIARLSLRMHNCEIKYSNNFGIF